MGVGVQLERQVGSIYWDENQPSAPGGGVSRTQKENDSHAVAHPQDGCLLIVKTDRWGKVYGPRVGVGVKSKMVDWCTVSMGG